MPQEFRSEISNPASPATSPPPFTGPLRPVGGKMLFSLVGVNIQTVTVKRLIHHSF